MSHEPTAPSRSALVAGINRVPHARHVDSPPYDPSEERCANERFDYVPQGGDCNDLRTSEQIRDADLDARDEQQEHRPHAVAGEGQGGQRDAAGRPKRRNAAGRQEEGVAEDDRE